MHTAALRELGLAEEWTYQLLPVPADLLAETVRALPAAGFAGANVTVPHKEAALALADEATAAAQAIGAANTLSFDLGGAIHADNTDAPGLLNALALDVAGRRAVVLGAGGSARAAVHALSSGGADVQVWNRTPERALALSRELGVAHVARPESAEIVVNATSVGLDSERGEGEAIAALGLEGLEPPAVVVDLVYAAGVTPVLAWGERTGARLVDGLEVLVRQGARSFERWTRRSAPLEIMRAAVRER
ncbi:MAG: shikimate dehydrogenase [Actinomycetota bacterium]|nr:shikimate dehydrogenase [Actinomycetota bacterium]